MKPLHRRAAADAPPPARHATRWGPLREAGPPALRADHATAFTLAHLEVPPGATVAEPGCGTGVLAIAAARAGAARVVGTDLDPAALAAAHANAAANGVRRRVLFCHGDLLAPVAGPLDLIVALLPHKPAPRPIARRYHGGPDGTDLLRRAIAQAAERLVQGGILLLYVNSISNPRRVATTLAPAFTVSLCAEKRRPFTAAEFEALTPGMFAHLVAQRRRGEAEFWEDAAGPWFLARLWRARRR